MKTAIISVKTKKSSGKENILRNIFKEIRLLRNEVSLFMPTESIEEYAHSERIRNSFKKALKHYPV